MRCSLIFAVAFTLAAPSGAGAQTRPLYTEEAQTAPAGTIVLEAGVQAISDEPNFLTGAPRGRWDGPELRVVFSPADTVELDVEWTVRVGARDDPDFGDVSDFGDVALRAKVRVAGGARDALALRFGVYLPETSFGTGLGPNTLRVFAQVLASKALGPATLHLDAGLALQDEPLRAHEQRDLLAYGVAVTWPVARIALVGEVAGLAGSGSPGADARSEARLGARLGHGRVRGDIAVRRGLTGSAGEWGITGGLSWTLRGPGARP